MTMLIQTLILSASVIIALASGLAFFYKKRTPETTAQLVMACAIIFLGASFQLYQSKIISLPMLTAANYLFGAIAATTHLFFSFYHTNRTQWIKPRIILGFLIQPILIQGLYWAGALSRTFSNFPIQIGDLLHTTYILILLSISNMLLVGSLRRIPRAQTRRWHLAVAIALLPFLVNLGSAIGGDLHLKITLSALSYALLLIGIAYGLFNTQRFEEIFITRDTVVEGMDDGWMVVDNQDTIVDLNRATEEMIGVTREKLYGQPISTILNDWSRIFKSSEGIHELDMRRSVKSNNQWRYLNIRISRLSDRDNVNFGHLIVWRDITKRKLAEDARQHARDELFVLLNTISSAASHSMSLEEFLSESIYQIIYSFRSQAVAVYLLDEKDHVDETLDGITLKAHFGIPPQYVKEITDRSLTSSIIQWLRDEQESHTFVVEDVHGDELQNYPVIREMGFSRLAMIPLVVVAQKKSNILGCLCLARSDDIPFTQDEIIRLKTISNQVATLIDSDRRRQFAIAVSERQRLMRDLHDSVSQKLYGLVALTEAAQAALEAGSEIAPAQVLTRIGENARQAVREMRLFLYEMQPVDLEEGLVSVLHHRLAAVEGRADIKARLLVDENIVLQKDREIALYFISQEALNNILRHAHAKNVSITLKQTRQNVILHVKDDGRGFDTKSIDEGGMGLRNMRERTLKIDGKFRISSRPGKGTQISIVIPRNN